MTYSRACAMAALVIVCATFAAKANATDYPVSGNVVINGNDSTTLPSGVSFGDSFYDTSNGDLSLGKFTFPPTTVSLDGGNGSVTYQLSQTNTSTGLVGEDGTAILTTAIISLKVTAASYGTTIDVGDNCIFAPIIWNNLRGTATSSEFDVAQAAFSVPPAADGACGVFTSLINGSLEGNNNSITLQLTGAFPAPAHSDLIFIDGFGL